MAAVPGGLGSFLNPSGGGVDLGSAAYGGTATSGLGALNVGGSFNPFASGGADWTKIAMIAAAVAVVFLLVKRR